MSKAAHGTDQDSTHVVLVLRVSKVPHHVKLMHVGRDQMRALTFKAQGDRTGRASVREEKTVQLTMSVETVAMQ